MGLIARKLLAEVGQAIVVAATAASSSTPSPLPHLDESDLTSPFNRNPDLNPILAITAALLMSIFFIVSFFSIYFQRCFIHVAGFDHDRIMILYNGGGAPPSSTASLPPSGLDGSFLETLPKVIFSSSCSSSGIQKEKKKEVAAVAAATECAICLEEFLEQETLRLLPHCGHSFHLECINMWLYSHTACPLCRHSLLHPGSSGNNGDTVAVAIAVNSQNNVVTMAANSVAAEEALQVRAAGTPKNTRGEGEEEEGESSEEWPGVIATDKLGNGDLPSSC